MAQIAEINQRLKLPDVLAPTADQLGLVGATTRRGSALAELAADYVLVSVSWDGDPEFPNILRPLRAGSAPTVHRDRAASHRRVA